MNEAIVYRWNEPSDRADAADFAGRVIGSDTAYISHGEIQAGLSEDAHNWSPDLAGLYAEDFADLGARDMLVARDANGKVVGLLIVAWEETPRRKFAVLEDVVVDPAMRGNGIGGEMVDRAHRRIAERGVDWTFLESGLRNEAAHRFFEERGYAVVSHVFARRHPAK